MTPRQRAHCIVANLIDGWDDGDRCIDPPVQAELRRIRDANFRAGQLENGPLTEGGPDYCEEHELINVATKPDGKKQCQACINAEKRRAAP